MSEKQGSPEKDKKPVLFDNCNGCKKQYKLTPNNAVVFNHDDTKFNFIYCACPNCDFRTRIFINDHTMEQARTLGIHIEEAGEPSQQVEDDWYDVKGLKKAETYQLTERQERLIGGFAATMSNCPEDMLYDFITAENPNRPYPERWT